jgi:carbon storage regulator CsrA
MLVLTRKKQEQVRIGQEITITVIRVKGNYVQLGIEAPREVRVVRGELPTFDADEKEPHREFSACLSPAARQLEENFQHRAPSPGTASSESRRTIATGPLAGRVQGVSRLPGAVLATS